MEDLCFITIIVVLVVDIKKDSIRFLCYLCNLTPALRKSLFE